MIFFFFKQKTAYELRISDWSSDVCSSDLAQVIRLVRGVPAAEQRVAMREASEAPDDVAVAADAFGAPGIDARSERHRERLVGRILRMGEGKHEEHPEAGLHARHVPQPLRFAPIGRASCRDRGGQSG